MWSGRTLAIGIVLLVALAVSACPEVATTIEEGAPVATASVIATSADETVDNTTGAGNRIEKTPVATMPATKDVKDENHT